MLKYSKGPTALLADFLDNVESVAAPDEQTFVLTYATPVAQSLVLSNLQQLFILPAHVWSEHDTDNGKGLNQDDLYDPGSLGLVGMRERARPWGGQIDFEGVPGRGTTVTVHMPYRKG